MNSKTELNSLALPPNIHNIVEESAEHFNDLSIMSVDNALQESSGDDIHSAEVIIKRKIKLPQTDTL